MAGHDRNVELWRDARDLFEQALDQPAAQRSAFIASACSAAPDLRQAVERLLAVDARSEHPLEAASGRSLTELAAQVEEDLWAGRRLGPYELVKKLGEGGMGSVFLAQRADAEFDQQVAVKIMQSSCVGDQGLDRFRRERQILARLEHPHIARLIDGGTTPEGLPFLVMEYVDGLPITSFCNRRQLTIDDRIALFRSVCAAVRYAHQNLVIHRDLKAANILVTADGIPKLLDFGIAKLIDTESAAAAQRPSTRILTPSYASPEQFAGRPITTTSDVYSLGILLYELLTDRRPRQLPVSSSGNELDTAFGTLPMAPSSALAANHEDGPQPVTDVAEVARARGCQPDALRHRLAGDLDVIVLHALRAEPEQRYGSAAELSDDLRRHVEGLPIHARPASLSYRFGKFARRHSSFVAAAAIATLSLISFAFYASVNSARLARERDIARQERRETDQLTRVLLDAFRMADTGQTEGAELTARQIADFSSSRISLELEHQPVTRASLLGTLGEVYTSLGELDIAADLLGESLTVRRDRFGSGHESVAESLHRWAVLEHRRSNFSQAEKAVREAIAIRQLQSPAAARASRHLLANILLNQDRNQEALDLHKAVLEAFEETGAPPDDTYVVGLTGLASAYEILTYFPEAKTVRLRALAIQEDLHPGPHPMTAEILADLVSLYRRMRLTEEALKHGLRGLRISRQLYGEEHASTAKLHGSLSTIYRAAGEHQKALESRRHALDLETRLLGDQHSTTLRSKYNLALLLHRNLNRHGEADAVLTELLPQTRQALGPGHSRLGFILTLHADVLTALDRPAEALPLLDDARQIFRRIGENKARWNIAMVESSRGNALISLGQLQLARPLLESAQTVLDQLVGPRNPFAVLCAQRRARLWQELGDEAAAASIRQRLSID